MDNNSEKGMLIHVYRCAGTSTTNGPSARVDFFVLIGPNIPKLMEPTETAPAIRIVEHRSVPGYFYLVPDSLADRHTTNGGNFGKGGDSRLSKIMPLPLPIHDRVE